MYKEINLPVSKSIGARSLVASYFAGTLPAEPMFDDNDDLEVLQEALLELYCDEEPIDYGESPIDVHASGTAFRFVTAVCASTPEADFVITGTPRLVSRPMKPLIDVLKAAGAQIVSQGKESLGPYKITGRNIEGGEFDIRGDVSSQFISALMLVAPVWEKGIKLNFTTNLISKPYISMTAKVMEKFSVKSELTDKYVKVENQTYSDPGNIEIEKDWSSASFFYEAVALGAPSLLLKGPLPIENSLQGDSKCVALFGNLGVLTQRQEENVFLQKDNTSDKSLKLNLEDTPDLVIPLAVTSAFNNIRFRFEGVGTLRHKESDRLDALKKELGKAGFKITITDDSIEWDGSKDAPINPLIIETYDDHRIAMAFAMVAFKTNEVIITNPDVVEKSFTQFWHQLPAIGLKCERKEDRMHVSLPSCI